MPKLSGARPVRGDRGVRVNVPLAALNIEQSAKFFFGDFGPEVRNLDQPTEFASHQNNPLRVSSKLSQYIEDE